MERGSLKAVIIGHITIDSIEGEEGRYESLGGPPLYMGLLLKRLGSRVHLHTRVGKDIGDERLTWILKNGLTFAEKPLSEAPTTRFHIRAYEGEKEVRLLARCSSIPPTEMRFDLALINTVAGEFLPTHIPKIKAPYRFLDPQGFLRNFRKGLTLLMTNAELKKVLGHINAIKGDHEELKVLTSMEKVDDAISYLHERGVKEVILTGKRGITLSQPGETYFLPGKRVKVSDCIGVGDMLGAAYAFGRLERGPLWGLALGYASVLVRIDKPALDKIPTKEEVYKYATKLLKEVRRLDFDRCSEM